MSASTDLERAIIEWARPKIEQGQVSAWPLRARAEVVEQRSNSEDGRWIHVHDDYEWVCSVKRSLKAGRITIYVRKGVRVVEDDTEGAE